MEYQDLIEILIEYCNTNEEILEQTFINTFKILQDQGLISVYAPCIKNDQVLVKTQLLRVEYNNRGALVIAMNIDIYDKNTTKSNSILIRKTINDKIVIVGISDTAKIYNLICGNPKLILQIGVNK